MLEKAMCDPEQKIRAQTYDLNNIFKDCVLGSS
jgi:hypothetical protein